MPIYPTHAEEGDLVETELEPSLRFTDPINRVAWHNMAYSPDGNWLAGGLLFFKLAPERLTNEKTGSADPATHKIYIWDIINEGQFATALDGGREPLLDVTVGGDDLVCPSFFSLRNQVASESACDCVYNKIW